VAGKCLGQPLKAASATGPSSRLLFVRDVSTALKFLVDTIAAVCVYPASRQHCEQGQHLSSPLLVTANNSSIATYGNVDMTINLGYKRCTWKFYLADVSQALLGADFLSNFNLAVDLRGHCLIDLDARGNAVCALLPAHALVYILFMTMPFHASFMKSLLHSLPLHSIPLANMVLNITLRQRANCLQPRCAISHLIS